MTGACRLEEPAESRAGIGRHTAAVEQDLAIQRLGLDDAAPGLVAQPGRRHVRWTGQYDGDVVAAQGVGDIHQKLAFSDRTAERPGAIVA